MDIAKWFGQSPNTTKTHYEVHKSLKIDKTYSQIPSI